MAIERYDFEVLRVRFKNVSTPPMPVAQQFVDLLAESGRRYDNLSQYWLQVSRGNIVLEECIVHDWIESDRTYDQFDPSNGQHMNLRGWAINAAVANNIQLDSNKILFIYWQLPAGANEKYPPFAYHVNGWKYIITNSTRTFHLNLFAHESGHCFEMFHTFDDLPNGEYLNPWDILGGAGRVDMQGGSTPTPYAYDHSRFEKGGPGLNGYNQYMKGWLHDIELLTLKDTDNFARWQIELFPCNSLSNVGKTQLVRLKDGNTEYWIEFRIREGWDRNVPNHGLLIHVKDGPLKIINADQNTFRTDWQAGEVFDRGNFKVEIEAISNSAAWISVINKRNAIFIDETSNSEPLESRHYTFYRTPSQSTFLKQSGIAMIDVQAPSGQEWRPMIVDVKLRIPKAVHQNQHLTLLKSAPFCSLASIYAPGSPENIGFAVDYFYLRDFDGNNHTATLRFYGAARGEGCLLYRVNYMLHLWLM